MTRGIIVVAIGSDGGCCFRLVVGFLVGVLVLAGPMGFCSPVFHSPLGLSVRSLFLPLLVTLFMVLYLFCSLRAKDGRCCVHGGSGVLNQGVGFGVLVCVLFFLVK